MDRKNYPETGWVLMPSFKPAEIKIRSATTYFGNEWYEAENGKQYRADRVFETLNQALAFGDLENERLADRIAKQQATLAKRQAAIARGRGAP